MVVNEIKSFFISHKKRKTHQMKITNRLMKISKPWAIQDVNSPGFNSLDKYFTTWIWVTKQEVGLAYFI